MSDFKNTLNLSSTSFPMRGCLGKRELMWLDHVNAPIIGQSDCAMMHGPAYANGDLHMGHALNLIIKDMYCRSQFGLGKRVEWTMGFDCHGLPIEIKADPEARLSGKEKIATCAKYAQNFIERQSSQAKRLGLQVNFDAYKTMDSEYVAHGMHLFARLYEKGHVKQNRQPIHICPTCKSALANAEVEHIDKTTESFYIKFPTHIANQYLLVWTTAPWTILANQFLAINPSLQYVRYKVKDEILILLDNKEPIALQLIQKDKISAQEIKGLTIYHPISSNTTPIVFSDCVSADEGTGIVHMAPAHGTIDNTVGKENNIAPMESIVGFNGVYKSGVLKGHNIFSCNKQIKELLGNNFFKSDNIVHSYPHCWRHKTPLFFSNPTQWFITLNTKNKNNIIQHIDTITAHEWEKSLLRKMVLSRPDWCISRSREWGIPIPVPVHKETGSLHPHTLSIMRELVNTVKQHGIEALYQYDLGSYTLPGVLDVWFDSGSYSSFYKHKGHRCIIEGIDQFRGWFQSLLILSVLGEDTTGFDQLVSHGFVLDKNQEKMSKSLGNIIDPMVLAENYGADVVRLWVAKSNFREDVHYSDDIMSLVVQDYRKIRNSMRFLLSTIGDNFQPEDTVVNSDMLIMDRWIVTKGLEMVKIVAQHYKSLSFHLATQTILHFCTKNLSNLYINTIRRRLYTFPKSSLTYRSAVTSCYHTLKQLCSVIKPILPFTTHEVSEIHKVSSFIIPDEICTLTVDESNIMELLLSFSEEVKRQSHTHQVTACTLYMDRASIDMLQAVTHELADFFVVSQVTLREGKRRVETVDKSDSYNKCPRCWQHYPPSVPLNPVCSVCTQHTQGEWSEKTLC